MKRLFLLLFLFASYTAAAQDFSGFNKASFIYGKDTLNYRILYPKDYDASKKYPVMLFLHGRGESGNDNEKQLTHGAKMFLNDSFRSKFPAIVIFPQCEVSSYWANVQIDTINGKRFFNFIQGGIPTTAMTKLLKFTDYYFKLPMVDQSRIYVGGLSMGGMGTYEILRRKNKTFAGAFAICGGDNVANAVNYRNVPLWIFHGGMDDVVNPQLSYAIYKELQKLGKTPKFTVYPKANHNSWDDAFKEQELMPWLFSQRK